MPLCIDPCVRPERNTVHLERSGPINGGDICVISASVKHPFLALFMEDSQGTLCTQQTRNDFKFLQEHPEAGKNRPCLVVDYRDETAFPTDLSNDSWRPNVCLMGTFSKCTDVHKMSRILQHFLVPVSPTRGMTATHFHTTPDWVTDGPQYIIAYPMLVPPDRPLTTRWQHFAPGEKSGSYYLSSDDISQWDTYCSDLYRKWTDQDAKIRQEAQSEFKVSQRLKAAIFSTASKPSPNVRSNITPKKTPVSIFSNKSRVSAFSKLPKADNRTHVLSNLDINRTDWRTPSLKTSCSKTNTSARLTQETTTASRNRYSLLSECV